MLQPPDRITQEHEADQKPAPDTSAGPLSPAPSVTPRAQAAIPPIIARRLYLGTSDETYELVDRGGLVISAPLMGRNSAAAIARMLDLYARGDGLCIIHLTETLGGRCLACSHGWSRHLLAARPR